MHPRFAKKRIEEALEDTRVVLISGPRQSGKTTLAMEIASKAMPFLTLDDSTRRDAAISDPVGFLRGADRIAIDEIQRAPELLLAIKAEVDKDKRPGRFLLTGSVNLMTLPRVADSLAGRMEIVQLLPLSQAEIRGGRGCFLDDALACKPPISGESILGKDLVELALADGYPDALARTRWPRRQSWLSSYAEAIVQRDVQNIGQIEQLGNMRKLPSVLAEYAGQLTNYSRIGAALGMNHVTTQKYMQVLESLYLTYSLQPWLANNLKRLIKSPKLHFLDSGLLSALRSVSPERVAKDRTAFGAILETFVFGEIRKLASWSDQRCSLFHFRVKDGKEVDLVVENLRGEVIGIEVKASATVSRADFSGLKKLASACGRNFIQGLVLYDHDQVMPFGENLLAAPLSCLWA